MGSLQQEQNRTAEFIQAESHISLNHFSGRKTPLFLFHDGGGTTFTYHCLDTLGRFVFAIGNPRFATGGYFEGGLREMGRLYAGYIKKTIAGDEFPAAARRRAGATGGKVEILLGGWSLGGLLSLEVARLLVDESEKIRVKGIVMIDSPYQPNSKEVRQEGIDGDGTYEIDEEDGKSKNQILAQKSMSSARRMVVDWEIPVWEGEFANAQPKTILLKARDYVPTPDGEGMFLVDRFRKDSHLGWKEHGEDFVEEVVDIPGDHFSLAVEPQLEETSKALKKACEELDSVPKSVYMH